MVSLRTDNWDRGFRGLAGLPNGKRQRPSRWLIMLGMPRAGTVTERGVVRESKDRGPRRAGQDPRLGARFSIQEDGWHCGIVVRTQNFRSLATQTQCG